MSGIYVHIPYCLRACHYCDFHFSTSRASLSKMLVMMQKELHLRKDYLSGHPVQTLYFGGGTPSILEPRALEKLLNTVHSTYDTKPLKELTLEANPEHLSKNYLKSIKNLGVNRLSIGIQSFHPPHLTRLGRNHSAQQAQKAVESAQDIGFDAISLDLIYGIPHPDHNVWLNDMSTAIKLQPEHLSCYALTIEPKTLLWHQQKKGTFAPAQDDFVAQQFDLLHQTLESHGYEHYELSNFAKPGMYASHNLAYWHGKTYLGIGPSAHSYHLSKRHQNLCNNMAYIRALEKEQWPLEQVEILSPKQRFNEHVLTRFRTKWGLSLLTLKKNFAKEVSYQALWEKQVPWLLKHKLLQRLTKDTLAMTQKGWLLYNTVVEKLSL